jgi:protein gp37
MNKQNPGIEWSHVWGRPGYTCNPISGCFHDCVWNMPDQRQAECYADTTASRVAQGAYPHGFKWYYWNPERLEEPARVKEPSGIFVGSMSDVFGHWVPDEHIRAVLKMCESAPQHIFFLLTKNAPRLLKFDFPPNAWVGVSMPPDYFMGKALSQDQQRRMLERSLGVLDDIKFKGVRVRWMSFEPLSWDVSPLLDGYCPVDWAVIGAASNGRNYYQPDPDNVGRLLKVFRFFGVPVFFKGNLRGNPAADPWREEYPEEVKA